MTELLPGLSSEDAGRICRNIWLRVGSEEIGAEPWDELMPQERERWERTAVGLVTVARLKRTRELN